ncbi:acyltransferase family protein [Aliivibrio fischeri]|uniref:acyltransferase family protein n=1 Tax=Aliivibrio fischeri TaxID=668 RepID=UPI0012D98C1D|nr:acyltransferase family protein [Aliivibrio fischeri]MUK29473.1 acyltransferase family protein [Aliivibrio fischeri]
MNSNINWVSGLKFFGIIAVILGHINSPLSSFIFSWHMPLFFMISGFFIKTDDNIKGLIFKDCKRLMIPYFIFSSLALGITSLKLWALNREALTYSDELVAIFFWMDYKHLIETYAFVLWFLPALFFARICYYIIMRNISNVLLQLCLFILLFLISFQIQLPFALSNAMNSALWIFIGSILFSALERDNKVNFERYYPAFTLLFPIMIVVVIYTYWGIPKLDMSSLKYDNKIINVLWAVSLFLLFIHLLKQYTDKKISYKLIEQWGRSTMILFILHPYTNNISHIIVEKLQFGGWSLKLFISLFLLQLLVMIKKHFSNRWIFKYV